MNNLLKALKRIANTEYRTSNKGRNLIDVADIERVILIARTAIKTHKK